MKHHATWQQNFFPTLGNAATCKHIFCPYTLSTPRGGFKNVSLNPDQAPDQSWQNAMPDLDPNCLTLWFFEKVDFEKKADDKKA